MRVKKGNTILFTIKQKEDMLREYTDQFTNVLSTISGLDIRIAHYAYTMGLKVNSGPTIIQHRDILSVHN